MLLPVLLAAQLAAQPTQELPRTRAEQSNYTATSSYEDVITFLDALQAKAGDRIRVGHYGTTNEGRPMPYVIASRPLVASPAEAKRLRRPVIFVQGNIHAGEVEGKEALQALLRDLIASNGPGILDSIVLIAAPIYNADGNERWGPQARQRGSQNGPAIVGQRPNAQDLDLNRDYIKAEAPETRASLALFNAWDPDVIVDLHTTNGSYHGYALTYSASLHPAGNLPTATFGSQFARDTLLPLIRRRVQQRHNYAIFDYGNFRSAGRGGGPGAGPDTMPTIWETYDHRQRFGTNYYALRGRIGILSEAYSHDPFEKRVKATYAFVREVLSAVAERGPTILAMAERSDRAAATGSLPNIPVRAALMKTPKRLPISYEILERTGDTLVTEPGVPRGTRRTGRFKTATMDVYDQFESTRTVTPPMAYLIPATADLVIGRLRMHGVVVEQLRAPLRVAGETFTVDSIAKAARPFQGHQELLVEGRWTAGTVAAPAGAYLVRTNQPLGVLAVLLLEPESDDGLGTWNFFDRWLTIGQPHPVLRVRAPVTAPARILP
jgi:hypothetical protein